MCKHADKFPDFGLGPFMGREICNSSSSDS